jgi:hypothetical protein
MKNHVQSFTNLDGLRRYLDTTPENNVFRGRRLGSQTGSEEFSGTESYAAANVLLRDGDEKSAAALKAAAGVHINAAGEGYKVRRYAAVCGGTANVAAALIGLPRSMYATKKVTYKDSKVLNLCYNGSADCSVDKNEIAQTAAALTNAVLGLEKNGYRVNLYVYFGSRCSTESCNMFVRIKDSGQYIDVRKMAYPLVNPSMLRRHFLRFVEVVPGLKSSYFTIGHGTPINDRDHVQTCAKEAGLNLKKVVSFYDLRGMKTPEIVKMLSC